MPRNAEVIRQWTILREIENARGAGVTIDDLATRCAVTTRTIRRDLQALEESGFPLYDDRTKTYLVHPYRLAYAQGGLYLLAYVPEYSEVRTFAVERIQDVSLLEERFTPIEELPDAAFPHSLGVHSGPPERVEIAFEAAVADYVRAREWHPSQQARDDGSGGVLITLDVCLDRALQSWILSFGPFARVVAPEGLARQIAAQFAEATARYTS